MIMMGMGMAIGMGMVIVMGMEAIHIIFFGGLQSHLVGGVRELKRVTFLAFSHIIICRPIVCCWKQEREGRGGGIGEGWCRDTKLLLSLKHNLSS